MEILNHTNIITNENDNDLNFTQATFNDEFDVEYVENVSLNLEDLFLYPALHAKSNYGVKNFKIVGDAKFIESASVSIGGLVVDTIYPSLTGDLEFETFKNVVPSLKYYEMRLYIKYLKKTELKGEFEIYKLLTPKQYEQSFKIRCGKSQILYVDNTNLKLL